MKFFNNASLLLIILFTILLQNAHSQDCEHRHHRTQNSLMPDLKIGLAPGYITENSAISVLGEIGRRNYRINGTYGYLLGCDDKIKVSSEYLVQKLGYNFSDGKAERWVRQFAAGAAYLHKICNPYFSGFEFSGYYSYSPSHQLRTTTCSNRHIAGANAYGCSLQAIITPWPTTFLKIDGDYDAVCYHRKYRSHRHITGFGGGVNLYQHLFCNFGLDLNAEFRRPFNYYRAALNWSDPCYPGWTVGVFGSHTRGKSKLPSTTMAGLEINYAFGEVASTTYANSCSNFNVKDECCVSPELKAWVSRPAVYMPEVLAIANERRIIPCPPPTATTIPNATFDRSLPTYSYDVSPFFTSPLGALTFSATGLPAGSSIDPVTGVISGPTVIETTFTPTITGTTSCGSVSETFTLTFFTS